MSSGEPNFKQLGNEEFRKGAYLKAAALYTRGLKLDPGNAVLLRSVSCSASMHVHTCLLLCTPNRMHLWSLWCPPQGADQLEHTGLVAAGQRT